MKNWKQIQIISFLLYPGFQGVIDLTICFSDDNFLIFLITGVSSPWGKLDSNCPGKCPGQVFIGRWLGVYLGRGHQSGRRIRNNSKCSPTPKSLLLKNATRWFAWRKKHIVFVRLKKIVIPKETVNSRIHPSHTWNFLHHWRQPTSNLQEICIATPSRSLTFSMENNCWF